MRDPRAIATTILEQLGGNRFRAMTGAKDFAYGNNGGLAFRIPVSKGINHVLVKYVDTHDLYDMRFCFVRSGKVHEKAAHYGVYAEDLQRLFKAETGLDTHL